VLNNASFLNNMNTWVQSNLIINSDSLIGGLTNNVSAMTNLIVNGYGTGAANPFNTPVHVWEAQASTLEFFGNAQLNNGPVSFRIDTNLTVFGGLTGNTAGIQKWGAGVFAVSGSSSLSANPPIGLYAGTTQIYNGIVGQTPLGSGSIAVYPGAILRIAGPNVGQVNLTSDGAGLAVLGLDYNPGPSGSLPAMTFANSGAPFDGTLAVDVVGFSRALNMATIGTGKVYLGAAATGAYTAATLGAGADSTYRLGTGGSNLNLNASVLVGANAVQIGAVNNGIAAQSAAMTNNGGTVLLNTPNTYTGGTTLNTGAALQLGAAGAIGAGPITFNGGAIQADAGLGISRMTQPLTISNAVNFTGDAIIGNTAVDTLFSGTFDLAPSGSASVGSTVRTLTLNNTAITYFNGAVSSGAAASSYFIKAGAGPLVLGNPAAYTPAFTQINAGLILVNNDTSIPLSSQIVLNGGGLGFSNAVPLQPVYSYNVPGTVPVPFFTTARNYLLNGTGIFDIGAGLTLTQAASSVMSGAGTLTKNGMGTLVLNGINPVASITINAGVLGMGADSALGDTTLNSAVTLNGPSATVPAALWVTNSFATPRNLTLTNGAVDVAAGATLTTTGVNGGTFVKTGLGTLLATAGASTTTALTISGGGVFASNTSTPFGAATITLNGGTLSIFQATTPANLTNTATTLTMNAGGMVRLQDGGTSSFTR
jgi:hypothetical protein